MNYDVDKEYELDGNGKLYRFKGYYFESVKPLLTNHVIVNLDGTPKHFINCERIFPPLSHIAPIAEVVLPEFHVAYNAPILGWKISAGTYTSIEDFYSHNIIGVSRLSANAHLLN
jgi:hypothetical protein